MQQGLIASGAWATSPSTAAPAPAEARLIPTLIHS